MKRTMQMLGAGRTLVVFTWPLALTLLLAVTLPLALLGCADRDAAFCPGVDSGGVDAGGVDSDRVDDGGVNDGSAATTETAMLVVVENGAYEGTCAYFVRGHLEDGQRVSFGCEVDGDDCVCRGGEGDAVKESGSVRLDLHGQMKSGLITDVLEQQVLDESAERCGAQSAALFAQPPIEEFVNEECEQAVARAEECGHGHIVENFWCVDQTRSAEDSAAEDGAAEDACINVCLASGSCDDYAATFCTDWSDGDALPPLVACMAGCSEQSSLEQSEEDLTLAAEVASAWCPE